MKVLLADDSGLILDRLQEMVRAHQHVEIVGLMNNGTETLDAIRKFNPDLAIVDIKMPGLTGLQVLSEIRKENQKIKFIILTFYSSDYFRQMAIKAGADYFFSKVEEFDKVSLVVKELSMSQDYYQEIKSQA